MEASIHEPYMRRCLDLAQLGAGAVSPNPMVGAVVVHQGRIIGEGWHQRYGGPHAEVNAIRSVANPFLLSEATLYCSLEPCFHTGKTPPCVDLILRHNIPRVVVANTDPNPLVAGQSVQKMRTLGIQVEQGVLETEGAWLNRVFFHWIQRKRPYVILKWAQSADGYMGKTGERTPISTPATRRLVHRWRSECDAILVGANTALIDNPQLDSRYYPVRSPLRICFDQRQQLPETHFLLDDTLATWILGPQRAGEWHHTRFMPLDGLDALMGQLYQHQKAALLVEGGPTLLSSFLKAGLADEIRIITHHARLHEGVKAPLAPLGWEEMEQYAIGADTIQLLAPSVKAP